MGKHVVKQALAKGHTVIAFGRNIESLIDADLDSENLIALRGYVFDEESVYNAVKDSEAVISVLGGGFDGVDKTRSLGIKNIITQMNKAGIKRIVALGNLAVLDASQGTMIIDTPAYPAEFLPVGREHVQALLYLKESDLNWTMVGAPNLLDEPATGKYLTAANHPPSPNAGKINAGNLALFMLSEISKNQFIKERVGISNEA